MCALAAMTWRCVRFSPGEDQRDPPAQTGGAPGEARPGPVRAAEDQRDPPAQTGGAPGEARPGPVRAAEDQRDPPAQTGGAPGEARPGPVRAAPEGREASTDRSVVCLKNNNMIKL